MYYIYILESEKDGNFYTGYSEDLKKRMADHRTGKVYSTKDRLPVKLIYYEACLNQQDATHREKYLKSAWGKRYLKTRLKNYLIGVAPIR
ncbi:MAG: GIY-YIG nuclease family protein [Candidatus Omnitrophica bacterium]|nr:GIY-YIG nuclease family protein [Candidatus Omnitrophota bacterium]